MIREATTDDAAAIAGVRVASWRATYAGLVPDAILARMDVARDEAWITDRIEHEGGRGTLVVEDGDGRVAGYAMTSACEDEDAAGLGEVQAIYLAPDARGHGLGRPLLEAAVGRLHEAGFGTVVLWVLDGNAPARRFYERAGFVGDGARRSLDFDGTAVDEIRYRRAATAPDYHPVVTTDAAPTVPPAVRIPERIRAFLEVPRVVSVATIGADGAPHQAAAWFRLDPDDRILLNSRTPRRWPADLRRDGRCSIAVIDADDGLRWIGVQGVVETIIDDVELARDDICDLAVRYASDTPEQLAAFRSQGRISFRIRITGLHDHLDG